MWIQQLGSIWWGSCEDNGTAAVMEGWVHDAKLHLNCNKRTNLFVLHFQSEIKGEENWAPWNLQKHGSQESFCTQAGENFYQTWHSKHSGDVWGQSCVIKYSRCTEASSRSDNPCQESPSPSSLSLSLAEDNNTRNPVFLITLERWERPEVPTGCLGESASHPALSQVSYLIWISTL